MVVLLGKAFALTTKGIDQHLREMWPPRPRILEQSGKSRNRVRPIRMNTFSLGEHLSETGTFRDQQDSQLPVGAWGNSGTLMGIKGRNGRRQGVLVEQR